MSNEFRGATLAEAIRAATAPERCKRQLCETKSDGHCNDLILEIEDLKREAGRLSDKSTELERDADALRRSAMRTLGQAALSALAGLAGAARGVSVALRLLSRSSVRSLSRSDVLGLLALLGPLGATAGALLAAADLFEAKRLVDEAEDIRAQTDRLGDRLLTAVNRYSRLGCGSDAAIT